MNPPIPKIDNIADLALLLEAAGIENIEIHHDRYQDDISVRDLAARHKGAVTGSVLHIYLPLSVPIFKDFSTW